MSKPIPVATPHTPEWYAARFTGIGASEMAAAVGLSEYRQPRHVYEAKVSQVEDVEVTESMEAGRFLEIGIKQWYCHRKQVTLLDPNPPMFRHPDYPFILATPDGIVNETKLLECKNAGQFMAKEWGDAETDQIPTDYLIQCQTQMFCLDAETDDLPVVIGGNKLKIYTLFRDEDLIKLIVSAAEELWERIVNRDPPPLDFNHKTTPALVRQIHRTENGRRIMLSEKSVLARREYEQLGETIKAAQKRQEHLRAIYEHEIGDNFAGVLPDGYMIRRKWMEPSHRSFDVDGRFDYRKVKFDDGPITPADELEVIQEREARWHLAGQLLEAAGATLSGRSDETESMYWLLPDGTNVRVSAHQANAATREWMESVSAREIRIDLVDDVGAAVAALGE